MTNVLIFAFRIPFGARSVDCPALCTRCSANPALSLQKRGDSPEFSDFEVRNAPSSLKAPSLNHFAPALPDHCRPHKNGLKYAFKLFISDASERYSMRNFRACLSLCVRTLWLKLEGFKQENLVQSCCFVLNAFWRPKQVEKRSMLMPKCRCQNAALPSQSTFRNSKKFCIANFQSSAF